MSRADMSVAHAQDWLLRWLKSRGHRVEGLKDKDLEERLRWRACQSKRFFQTAKDAVANGPKMNVYKCNYCEGYHLTTPTVFT